MKLVVEDVASGRLRVYIWLWLSRWLVNARAVAPVGRPKKPRAQPYVKQKFRYTEQSLTYCNVRDLLIAADRPLTRNDVDGQLDVQTGAAVLAEMVRTGVAERVDIERNGRRMSAYRWITHTAKEPK